MKNQVKVNNTQKYSDSQGEHIVCEGKLIEVEVFKSDKLRFIIISETEEIEVGDHFIWIDSLEQGIKKAIPMDVYIASNEIPIDLIGETGRKILALPEHFSNKHLQAIVDGKMKDGDKVLIKCKEYWEERNVGIPPKKHKTHFPDDYQTHLDQQNHITLFPVKQSLDKVAKLYVEQEMKRKRFDADDVSFKDGAEWAKKNNY